MTGLLLVGVAVSLASQATPIGSETSSPRDAARLESGVHHPDRQVVGEVAQEMQRSGSGVTPSVLGIDNAFVASGSMLHNEQLRDEVSNRLRWTGRVSSVRHVDSGGPDIFKDTINSALRTTLDAFLEGGDTANFSLAGIDLNLTLRGDRRGISINGYELLAANQQGDDLLRWTSSDTIERKQSSAHPDMLVRQYADDGNDTIFSLAEIRKLVSDPMMIAGMLVLLGAWLVLSMVSRRG